MAAQGWAAWGTAPGQRRAGVGVGERRHRVRRRGPLRAVAGPILSALCLSLCVPADDGPAAIAGLCSVVLHRSYSRYSSVPLLVKNTTTMREACSSHGCLRCMPSVWIEPLEGKRPCPPWHRESSLPRVRTPGGLPGCDSISPAQSYNEESPQSQSR